MRSRLIATVSVPLAASCSLVGIERPPATIDVTTPLACTDSYWLPTADGAALAGVIGLTAWSIREAAEGCEQGDERCDGQSGLLLLLAIPFVVSAIYGVRKVNRCRDAKSWQSATSHSPLAGQIGAACIPVYDGEGRCNSGYCDRGQCAATPGRVETRRQCADLIANWRAATDDGRRRALFAGMPPACQSLVEGPD